MKIKLAVSLNLVDAHIHCSELPDDVLINYARFNGLEYNLTELLNLMEENEVQLGLLLSPPISGGIPAPNSRIIELCQKSNDTLFPVLTVEPQEDEVFLSIKMAKEYKGYVKG